MSLTFLTLGIISLFCMKGIINKIDGEMLSKCKMTFFCITYVILITLMYFGICFFPKFYVEYYAVVFGTDNTNLTNLIKNLMYLIIGVIVLIGLVLDIKCIKDGVSTLIKTKCRLLEKGYHVLCKLLSLDLIFRLGMTYQKGTIGIKDLEAIIYFIIILRLIIRLILKFSSGETGHFISKVTPGKSQSEGSTNV